MVSRGLRLTKNADFSLLTHTKQLLSVAVCDSTAGIESEMPEPPDQTDMKVEIDM